MAKPMPESVKIARVGVGPVDSPHDFAGTRFPISLGEKEVMVLLAFHWWWTGTPLVGANITYQGLWRKSETLPVGAGMLEISPDMVWAQLSQSIFVTESVKASDHAFITLPHPLVLIRSPQYLVRMFGYDGFKTEMRLFYLLQKIKDVEMAKLMVKDHA